MRVSLVATFRLPLLNDSGLIEAREHDPKREALQADLPLLNDSGLIEAYARSPGLGALSSLPLLNDSGLIEANTKLRLDALRDNPFRC